MLIIIQDQPFACQRSSRGECVVPADSLLCSKNFEVVKEAEQTLLHKWHYGWWFNVGVGQREMYSFCCILKELKWCWICKHCVEIHFSGRELDLLCDMSSTSSCTRSMARATQHAKGCLLKEGFIMYPDITVLWRSVPWRNQQFSLLNKNTNIPFSSTLIKTYLDSNKSFHHESTLGCKKQGGIMMPSLLVELQ
jgi:hypothetical protein